MTRALERRVVRGATAAIATWFGCGRSPIAPGTCGALGALPLYALVRIAFGERGVAVAAALVTALGIVVADRYARARGVKDPQEIVIDEVAGTLVALSVGPRSLAGVAVLVLLFRGFDILKPGPIRSVERLPGGVGIVLDDVAAGALAAAAFAVVRALAA